MGSNHLLYAYETHGYSLRLHCHKTGEGGGHRTRIIRLWRPTFYQSELHPHCQRATKNPALGRVRCRNKTLRPSTHGSPNDPFGHSGYHVFEGLLHKSHSLLKSTSIRHALQFNPYMDRIL